MKGRKLTPEQIAKSIEKRIEQKRSSETKAKISAALTGLKRPPRTEEEKFKRSMALKRKSKSKESSERKAETLKQMAANGTHHSQIFLECPHCGTKMKKIIYARWHGDNCKQKKGASTTNA